ncbi:MAG: terpene cyclase/mutase family protein [Desulfobacterales bacterium]|nr:terpene cyclase/mutase family protein [Desulfobacterales bacterium]
MKPKHFIYILLAVLLSIPVLGLAKKIPLPPQEKQAYPLALSLLNETRHSLEIAFGYLTGQQQPNGSWKNDPAITALVLYSFLQPPSYNPDADTAQVLKRGFVYLETFVKPDGGIYQKGYRNYTTAVCLMAFAEAGQAKYKAVIVDAKNFLIKFQLDEGEGIAPEHKFYGGIGYGGDARPDLSNLHLALDAIKAAEDYETRYRHILPEDSAQIEQEEAELGLHWRKALVFLARTQNIKEINDMPYAVDDGGFIYETGHYKEARSHSYGSMTYAGVKSLLHARVDKNDLRVRRALAWINNHYTLEENPGFGTASLYYYYMTAAKCLAVLDEDVLVDAKGDHHHWREDFSRKLISLQHEDGYWHNANGRYWENIKVLTTAYAVIAMKHSLHSTKTQ